MLREAIPGVGVAEVYRRRAVGYAGPHIVDADDVVCDTWVVVHVPGGDRRGPAGLEQQPARPRRVPAGLDQTIGVEPIRGDVVLLRLAGGCRPAIAPPLLVVGEADLVLRRRLPRDPPEARLVPLQPPAVAVNRPIHPWRPLYHLRVGRPAGPQESTLRLVPVDAGFRPREPPAPAGPEEPQPVF